MIKKFLKNVSIWILFVALIWVFWLYTYKKFNKNMCYISTNDIADFSNIKNISWFADNIFVWKIIDNLWWLKWENLSTPNTNFKVKVLYNIKWNLKWERTTLQQSGYDWLWTLCIMNWQELLKKWNIYLLSTKWEIHTIMSNINWIQLLSSDKNLSKSDIKKLIKENWKIKEFRDAYKNEVYYEECSDWMCKISSEKNAYKNLNQKEKDDFENIENGFAE